MFSEAMLYIRTCIKRQYFKFFLICGFTVASILLLNSFLNPRCCTELKKDCLACQNETTVSKFCWAYPGKYGCPHRILLAISTRNEKGYIKFISSVTKKYLALYAEDILVLDNNSEKYEGHYKKWFGEQVTILYSTGLLTSKDIQHKVLKHFVNSQYDMLLHIDSRTMLHKDWQDFVNNHIMESSGALSLLQTPTDDITLSQCTDTSCTVNSVPNFGIVVNKQVARSLLDLVTFPDDLIKVTPKVLAPLHSLILRFGRKSGETSCHHDDSPLRLSPCHFPTWIKEGIEFFDENCAEPDENYVEKDHLPREDGNEVKKIGILLVSTSSSRTETCLKSIAETVEHQYKYTLYIGISRSGASMNTKDDFKRILPDDMSISIVMLADDKIFSEKVNSIFRSAYADGMDYFMHVSEPEVLRTKGWTSCAIATLMSHGPPNVGVVEPSCISYNTSIAASFVSRLHYDVFGSFYPANLDEKNALKWISEVYKDRSNEIVLPQVLENSIAHGYEVFKNWSRPVVSFALYGSNPRYTDGAIANMKLMPKYFSGWQMWVYYDDTVPLDILAELCQNGVQLIDMTGFPLQNQMSWRFLVASEPVTRYIVRDIDSRLSRRDRAAVDEWVSSGKKFHTIRDHPNHAKFAMNGGMWGGTYDAIPTLKVLLMQKNPSGNYIEDMNFLNNVVWSYAKKSVLQHDELSGGRFGETRPFPLPPVGNEFVGDVYINGTQY